MIDDVFEVIGCLGRMVLFLFLIGLPLSAILGPSQKKMMQTARKSGSMYHYAEYVQKHPDGRYVSEAEDSVYSLCARKGDFQDYVEIFPSGKHIPELEKKAQNAYDDALKAHSIEIWKQFKENHPTAFHADADAQIEELWYHEVDAWQEASNLNTAASYAKYLELHPKGKHHRQAEKRLIDLEVDAAFAGKHGNLPSMEKGYSTGTSYSIVEIENQTQYDLTVSYSGPDNKRIVIAPGATRSVRIGNGNYRVAAFVGNGVRPFAGTESLDGSHFSSSFYISRNGYPTNPLHNLHNNGF